MGRFINADALVSTGQGISGNNMFAYCLNNPVMGVDPSGFSYRNFEQIALEPGGGCGLAVIGVGISIIPLLLLTVNEVKEIVDGLVQELQQIQVSAPEPKGEYTVYFLCASGDPNKTIIYVGRVKSDNFKDRMNYHRRKGREYVDSITNLSYEQCRAFEQGGMMYYHTLNRDAALNNQIRGIGPSNSKRHIYLMLISEIINRGMYPENTLLPLSYWDNLTENEFLNNMK